MGVPKFFRYISERYPCLSELARENCIPDFDNLYLDMNGIIHNCSHPDDGNVHFNISEEDMFKDICNYIDKLFFLIKPQRLFFMAVDGVAPRAKMNQQRGRRFRSAKEAETLSLQAKNRGEVIENDPFDSNCITPGTEFMQRLHNALRFFVKNKISTDPLWQKCRVILSGHDSPGEGEHKIMDYIRYLKSQKDFDPHTRHCLYGLDADLIFLGLCTHELHFVVLREEVKFGRKTKRASVEETRFFLLHLGLFKEYLELEFATLKHYESFNMSKLIDDWVLMGFLVGNDFIPHLPCLHISSNALPLVYQTYIKIYPKLDGNINENGVLNLKRLEIFFEALADVEFQMFEENHADLKYFEGKQTKNGVDEAFDFDVSEILENKDDDLAQLIESSRQLFEGDEMNEITSDDEEQHIFDEFRTYKRNYYIKKLHYEEMTPEVLAEQAETYVTALQWVLDYYYKGVQSWSWYYPHHYAPFISDLKNFKNLKIKYEMSQPFLPFEQLLAVLPAASRKLLPEAYQHLFISPDSEIIEFYPTDFETDLNGKKNEWESIILIPFIDEKLLLRAMKKCEGNLTPSEVKRNTHGPMLQYDYTSQSQGECQSSFSVKAIYHVFCTEKSVWRDEIFVSNDVSPLIEMENAKRDVFYPGFPSMKHLKFKFSVKYARVKVFDFPTRNESMVLLPEKDDAFDDIEVVAKKCIDQIVYVGWPHLIKAKVMSVSNTKICITSTGTSENNTRMFEMQCRSVREHLSSRMGIEVPDFKVLVHVRTLVGTTLSCGSQGRVTNNDVWSSSDISYPPSVIVFDLKVHSVLSLLPKKVENIFPVDSQIFFVGNPYFGSEGTVLDPLLVYEVGRLKVSMTVLPEPNLSEARAVQNYLESLYCNAYDVQAILGLSTRCLSKLTAQLWLFPGNKRQNLSDNNAKKTNIGLLIKFPKQNEELSGYTHRKDNSWFFSPKAVALVRAYIEKFPLVTHFLQQICSSSSNEFHYADIFPNIEVAEKYVENIVKWLGEQEFTKADRVPCGTKCVEKGAVDKVIESIEKLKTLPVKTVKLQVKPHLLMKPDVNMPEQYKPKGKIRLFDRIVVVRTTYLVPIGSRGTVIGVLPISDPNPVRLECVKQTSYFLDVIFDKSIPFGNSIYGQANGRVMRVPETAVLCIFNSDNFNHNEVPEKIHQSSETRITDNTQKVNIMPEAATFNIGSLSKTNSTSASKLQNNLKNNEENISNSNTVVKEDFWMPAPETIKKNFIASAVADNSNLQKSYPNHVDNWKPTNTRKNNTVNMNVGNQESNLNSGTEALKSMLGLHAANTNMPLVNASQFPPPPNWRNSVGPMNKNNGLLPLPNSADITKKNDVPLQFYGQCLPHFAPQQQLPYVNDNFYSPMSLNQKGAFIPLQVLKSSPNKMAQELKDVEKIEETIKKCSIKDENRGRRSKSIPTEQPAQAASILLETPQTIVPKKAPKLPKIAARFDNL